MQNVNILYPENMVSSKVLKFKKNRIYAYENYPLTVKIKDGQLFLSNNQLGHLRWMLQKDILGQDVFLIGAPGSFR